MALITISGLNKSFGEVVAVDKVTMEIAEGNFTSFLGPSGCGKTTMLRMMAELEDPAAGEIGVEWYLVKIEGSRWRGILI